MSDWQDAGDLADAVVLLHPLGDLVANQRGNDHSAGSAVGCRLSTLPTATISAPVARLLRQLRSHALCEVSFEPDLVDHAVVFTDIVDAGWTVSAELGKPAVGREHASFALVLGNGRSIREVVDDRPRRRVVPEIAVVVHLALALEPVVDVADLGAGRVVLGTRFPARAPVGILLAVEFLHASKQSISALRFLLAGIVIAHRFLLSNVASPLLQARVSGPAQKFFPGLLDPAFAVFAGIPATATRLVLLLPTLLAHGPASKRSIPS